MEAGEEFSVGGIDKEPGEGKDREPEETLKGIGGCFKSRAGARL